VFSLSAYALILASKIQSLDNKNDHTEPADGQGNKDPEVFFFQVDENLNITCSNRVKLLNHADQPDKNTQLLNHPPSSEQPWNYFDISGYFCIFFRSYGHDQITM